MTDKFFIDPDIKKAFTLPAEFYRSKEIFKEAKEKIFTRCWYFVGDTDLVKIPGTVHPFTILDGYVNEPLLLTRDQNDTIHCLSNVCTHRGNILVENSGVLKVMQCRYHGRRFELNGCFKSMPECEDAENFPAESDSLSKVPFEVWNKFIFASVNPIEPLGSFLKPIEKRMDGGHYGGFGL